MQVTWIFWIFFVPYGPNRSDNYVSDIIQMDYMYSHNPPKSSEQKFSVKNLFL